MFSKRISSTRQNYALRLSYAITTHKVQGDTLESGVISLGKSERNLGTVFVQISRFKKLNQFLIEPFPFDRLQKIAKSECLPGRIAEEKKLNDLFKITKEKYNYLIKQ